MKITNEGEKALLEKTLYLSKAALAQSLTGETEDTFEYSDLVEANFPGYSQKSPVAWDSPATDGSGYGSTDCDQIIWTAGIISSAQTIYWILLLIELNAINKVLAAHLLPTPIVVNTTGQEIKVDVRALCSKFTP